MVSRPLQPKWAVPHPIISQNMTFKQRIFLWTIPLRLFISVWMYFSSDFFHHHNCKKEETSPSDDHHQMCQMRFGWDVISRFVCRVIVSSSAGDDNINHFANTTCIAVASPTLSWSVFWFYKGEVNQTNPSQGWGTLIEYDKCPPDWWKVGLTDRYVQ